LGKKTKPEPTPGCCCSADWLLRREECRCCFQCAAVREDCAHLLAAAPEKILALASAYGAFTLACAVRAAGRRKSDASLLRFKGPSGDLSAQ